MKGVRVKEVFFHHPHSLSVEFGMSQVVSCLECGATWPWREYFLHFLSAVSVGFPCIRLCFGPWNNKFALRESGQLCQVPIQDGRMISNPWCLASWEGQGPYSGKSPSSKLHHNPSDSYLHYSWHFPCISTLFTVCGFQARMV